MLPGSPQPQDPYNSTIYSSPQANNAGSQLPPPPQYVQGQYPPPIPPVYPAPQGPLMPPIQQTYQKSPMSSIPFKYGMFGGLTYLGLHILIYFTGRYYMPRFYALLLHIFQLPWSIYIRLAAVQAVVFTLMSLAIYFCVGMLAAKRTAVVRTAIFASLQMYAWCMGVEVCFLLLSVFTFLMHPLYTTPPGPALIVFVINAILQGAAGVGLGVLAGQLAARNSTQMGTAGSSPASPLPGYQYPQQAYPQAYGQYPSQPPYNGQPPQQPYPQQNQP